jgi:hypothetical protein
VFVIVRFTAGPPLPEALAVANDDADPVWLTFCKMYAIDDIIQTVAQVIVIVNVPV